MTRILKALAIAAIAVSMSDAVLAQTANRRLSWEYNGIHWGVPAFTSVTQAVSYMTNEVEFLTANVPTSGSSHFPITTSTGATTDNWHVSCTASLLFSQFGTKECIPTMIELLDHDEPYVRYAAYQQLQQKAGRYDYNYTWLSEKEKRQPGVGAWLEWWKKNKDNPRLDSPPKRVYEATEWEKGNESTEQEVKGTGAWGPVTNGLKCRVTTGRQEYRLSEPIRVLMEVVNSGTSPVSFGWAEVHLSVIQGDKDKPPYFFSTTMHEFPEKKDDGSPRTLASGEVYTRTVIIKPWGPTHSSRPSVASPGKMTIDGFFLYRPDASARGQSASSAVKDFTAKK